MCGNSLNYRTNGVPADLYCLVLLVRGLKFSDDALINTLSLYLCYCTQGLVHVVSFFTPCIHITRYVCCLPHSQTTKKEQKINILCIQARATVSSVGREDEVGV